MPARWPVYDLAAHPATCVRFNRHAVYLGSPSAEQRCPAHQIGRTDAILVENPVRAARAADGRRASGGRWRMRHTCGCTACGSPRPGAARRASVAQALGLRGLRTTPDVSARPAAGLGASAAAGSRARIASVGTGLGFDPCATPSSSTMSAWKSSPYHFVGVYLGGANMACSQPNLTTSWVRTETAAGWRFIPTWVGRQAPTSSCGGCSTIQSGQATSEGTSEATAAIARARAVGIGPGNPIYFDMEAYTPGSSATSATRTFLAAWTKTLHAARIHLRRLQQRRLRDRRPRRGLRRQLRRARRRVDRGLERRHSTSDPYVPAADWSAHQRLHQFNGGQDETHGGVTLNIDGDYLDGAVAGYGTGTVAPQFPDGTVLQDGSSQLYYRVAGGAPLFVSDLNAIGFSAVPTVVSATTITSMNAVPVDKTFLLTNTGLIFRIAGRHAVPDHELDAVRRCAALRPDRPLGHHQRRRPRLASAREAEGRDDRRGSSLNRRSGRSRAAGATRSVTASTRSPSTTPGLQAFPLVSPPNGGSGLLASTCVVPVAAA